MSKNTGGWAFPCPQGTFDDNGMTLRDYFAAKALPCVLQSWGRPINEDNAPAIARECYVMADAMLLRREV